MHKITWAGIISILLIISACQKTDEPATFGQIAFEVHHEVDGENLNTDALIYTNGAGNRYMVNEIQWFISNLTLIGADGSNTELMESSEENIFYIDTDIEESWHFKANKPIPAGRYSGLRFTFGLDKALNKSHRFVNPPESFMFWPTYLGGGYHYMKLNGKWINTLGINEPFNFHLGIGQEYYEAGKTNEDFYVFGRSDNYEHCEGYLPPENLSPVIAFIHNNFTIELPLDFEVMSGQTTQLDLVMQVEKWFNSRELYDHDQWGGAIMQQQAAMEMGCRNGVEAFHLRRSN
ncbi:MAG: hypothetical protein PF694_14275 [Bacteroidetes bacterium]|jgi:hypothetical protein|nr:hypothetical protein [Bacteroidota bacterium]